MSKPVIAVDIDEVLSPLHDLVFAHHNEAYGTNFPLRETGGSYFISAYTGESDEITRQKLKRFVETEAFRNVEPLEDAVAVLQSLKSRFDILIVTARQDFYYDTTHSWLEKHFPKVFTGVFFVDYVFGTGPKVPKSQICLDNKAAYLIDDTLDNALESAEAGLEVLLFGEYPWNIAEHLPHNVTRVENWRAVKQYFDERS